MGVRNPWHPDTWNVTEQTKYARDNGLAAAQERARSVGTMLGASLQQTIKFRSQPPAALSGVIQKQQDAAAARVAAADFARESAAAAAALMPPKKERPMVYIQRRNIVTPSALPLVLGFLENGVPTSSQEWMLGVAPFKAAFPGSSPSQAFCVTAPTDDATLTLQSNAGVLCTVTFAADANTGTFAWTPGASVSAGDVLYVYAQASPDATLAGINIAFIGQQSPA